MLPISNPRFGVPVTVVASLIVTVTVTTSPAFNVLFWMPVAPLITSELTVGGVVSDDPSATLVTVIATALAAEVFTPSLADTVMS